MTRHAVASDGARLAYDDTGPGGGAGFEGRTGPAVLCLPGLTRTMADFGYLLPHLPPVRVIRMDYRGRGGSDWTGAATYTVAQEARDALDLLDHLGVARVAIIGTSRGGLIGMALAATVPGRVAGLLLNDIGPEIARPGLERIFDHVGRNPAARTHAALAAALPGLMAGFAGVPASRWAEEARLHYRETPDGLRITYDPALRDAFLAGFAEGSGAPPPDLWPLFDACAGRPLACLRGAGSDLLTRATLDRMRARRPDMLWAEVPGRGHIPFLDEPESLGVIRAFLAACGA